MTLRVTVYNCLSQPIFSAQDMKDTCILCWLGCAEIVGIYDCSLKTSQAQNLEGCRAYRSGAILFSFGNFGRGAQVSVS